MRQALEPGVKPRAVVLPANVEHDLADGASDSHALPGTAALGHERHGQHELRGLDDAEDARVEVLGPPAGDGLVRPGVTHHRLEPMDVMDAIEDLHATAARVLAADTAHPVRLEARPGQDELHAPTDPQPGLRGDLVTPATGAAAERNPGDREARHRAQVDLLSVTVGGLELVSSEHPHTHDSSSRLHHLPVFHHHLAHGLHHLAAHLDHSGRLGLPAHHPRHAAAHHPAHHRTHA